MSGESYSDQQLRERKEDALTALALKELVLREKLVREAEYRIVRDVFQKCARTEGVNAPVICAELKDRMLAMAKTHRARRLRTHKLTRTS